MPTNKWIAGARPRTLPAAVAPVFVGTALRHTDHAHVDLINALLALLVSLALQVGVNYANDYSDGIRELMQFVLDRFGWLVVDSQLPLQ